MSYFALSLFVAITLVSSADDDYSATTTSPPVPCEENRDCQQNQRCEYGVCLDMPYACYDSDECRGRQVCDMRKFVCVDPTPAPTTPGCCMGDSYKSNDKCMRATAEDKCEDQGCIWLNTRDPSDCVITTTTTTEEPGCCSSDDVRKFDRCNEKETRDQCERSDDCFFVSGVNAVCEPQETTVEEGCCMGDSMKSQEKCSRATDRDRCEDMGCEFIVTDDPRRDCEFTTSTEEPGCCKGDSAKSNAMCNSRTEKDMCDRSSSCHWIIGGELEKDCAVDPTTTEEPGCCYGNPDTAYSAMWMESCTAFYTERECLKLTDEDGEYRCHWEDKDEEYDCSQLWPTTTSTTTTTAEPGCCMGDSMKSQDKCSKATDRDRCEDMGCEFIVTDDPRRDCEFTTSTEEPGCCKGLSAKSNAMCNERTEKDMCDRSSSCFWILGGELELDCVLPPTTTEEPGCCYGNPDTAYSGMWMESCTGFYTERECLKLTDEDGAYRCHWEDQGEEYDCSQLWPTTTSTTTTSTTEETGCCSAFEIKNVADCNAKLSKMECERGDRCEWRHGEPIENCQVTTTSTDTPTTTELIQSTATSDSETTPCDTTTTESWLGEAAENDHALPYNPYKIKSKSKKSRAANHQQESMLFGGEGVVGQTMQSTVSLSTVLLVAFAAVAVWQLFRWASQKKAAGYVELADAAPSSAQLV